MDRYIYSLITYFSISFHDILIEFLTSKFTSLLCHITYGTLTPQISSKKYTVLNLETKKIYSSKSWKQKIYSSKS